MNQEERLDMIQDELKQLIVMLTDFSFVNTGMGMKDPVLFMRILRTANLIEYDFSEYRNLYYKGKLD